MWTTRILLSLSKRSSRPRDARYRKPTLVSLEFGLGFIRLPKHHRGLRVSTLKNTVSRQSCIKDPSDTHTTLICRRSRLPRRFHSRHAPLLREKFRDSSTEDQSCRSYKETK